MQLHHVVLFVHDAERSLRFYRDGVGCTVLVDREFDGDWPTLLGVASTRLRAIILGQPRRSPRRSGGARHPRRTGARGPTAGGARDRHGHAVVPRRCSSRCSRGVVALGATDVRRTTLANGHAVATVRDPDGIMVELMDRGDHASS